MQVPINDIRMFPESCAELRDYPPMAYKFLLGDVVANNTMTLRNGKDNF